MSRLTRESLADSGMDLEALGLDFELPAEEELSDLDDTGINTGLTAKLQADEIPAGEDDLCDATVLMDETEAEDMEVTAQMPVRARADDTVEQTARLPGRDADDSDFLDELTAELQRAGNDATVEMDVESGRVNTKKRIG